MCYITNILLSHLDTRNSLKIVLVALVKAFSNKSPAIMNFHRKEHGWEVVKRLCLLDPVILICIEHTLHYVVSQVEQLFIGCYSNVYISHLHLYVHLASARHMYCHTQELVVAHRLHQSLLIVMPL